MATSSRLLSSLLARIGSTCPRPFHRLTPLPFKRELTSLHLPLDAFRPFPLHPPRLAGSLAPTQVCIFIEADVWMLRPNIDSFIARHAADQAKPVYLDSFPDQQHLDGLKEVAKKASDRSLEETARRAQRQGWRGMSGDDIFGTKVVYLNHWDKARFRDQARRSINHSLLLAIRKQLPPSQPIILVVSRKTERLFKSANDKHTQMLQVISLSETTLNNGLGRLRTALAQYRTPDTTHVHTPLNSARETTQLVSEYNVVGPAPPTTAFYLDSSFIMHASNKLLRQIQRLCQKTRDPIIMLPRVKAECKSRSASDRLRILTAVRGVECPHFTYRYPLSVDSQGAENNLSPDAIIRHELILHARMNDLITTTVLVTRDIGMARIAGLLEADSARGPIVPMLLHPQSPLGDSDDQVIKRMKRLGLADAKAAR